MKISNLPQATVITGDDLFVIVDNISGSEKQTQKVSAETVSNYILNQVPASGIFEYSSYQSFPVTGSSGKLYVALNSNTLYRWDSLNNQYTQLSSSGFSSNNLSIVDNTISSINNNDLILNSSTNKFIFSSTTPNVKKYTFILKNTTNNLESKSLTLDGSSLNINNSLVIPNKATWNYDIKISAYSNNQNSAIFNLRGGIQTTLSGSASLISDYLEEDWKSNSLQNCSVLLNPVVINGPGGISYLDIITTGVSGSVLQWVAMVDICEIIFD